MCVKAPRLFLGMIQRMYIRYGVKGLGIDYTGGGKALFRAVNSLFHEMVP